MPSTPERLPGGRIKAFPITWVTSGRSLLLVGGCQDRLCRLHHALHFDWARIRVVIPPGTGPLCDTCLADERVCASDGNVTEQDVQDADLVVESTTDRSLAKQLHAWCQSLGVPLNAMDKLEYCDLYYASLLMRGPLVLAISSGGGSPALSAALRKRLDEHIGPGWGDAARLLAQLRERLPNTEARSALLSGLAGDPVFLQLTEQNDVEGMRAYIEEAHDRFRTGD